MYLPIKERFLWNKSTCYIFIYYSLHLNSKLLLIKSNKLSKKANKEEEEVEIEEKVKKKNKIEIEIAIASKIKNRTFTL